MDPRLEAVKLAARVLEVHRDTLARPGWMRALGHLADQAIITGLYANGELRAYFLFSKN